jgi:thymidylate synthase (FAD)
MRIIKPYYVIESNIKPDEIIQHLEKVGRTCYKSEDKIGNIELSKKFLGGLIDRGHEAIIEHASITVRVVCDRGVSHEIVRHRLASYAQESTRYCNYSKDKFDNQLTYIDIMPIIIQRLDSQTDEAKIRLGKIESKIIETLSLIEKNYMELIELGVTPQEARGILPNLLKTEIVMTMNIREWRHFFRLRTSKAAHPQIREIAIPLLEEIKRKIPVLFDDIIVDEKIDVVEIKMPKWTVIYVNGALYAQGYEIPWEVFFDLGRSVGKKDFNKTTYILGEKKQKRLNFYDPPLNISMIPGEIFNQDDKE